MCQLTSPSLKIIFELPSTAGISSTAMNSGMTDRRFAGAAASSATDANSRPLRRPAAVDRIKHEADDLRRHEEQLGPVRKADEEVKAAEDSDGPDDGGRGGAELPLRLRLAAAKDEHRGANRDEGRERPGIGQRRDRREWDQPGEDRRDDRRE